MKKDLTSFENKPDFQDWLKSYDSNDTSPVHLISCFLSGVQLLGIEIYRSSMWLPTAHPELWGTQVVWTTDDGAKVFKRDHDITSTPIYLNTPGEAVHQQRQALRWKLDELTADELPYPLLSDLKQEGGTDYLIVPFHTDHAHEQPWITFVSKKKNGFSDSDIETLKNLCLPLGWKARVSMAESATNSLLSIYLGSNAAQRVMEGQFRRGTGHSIHAVIWFCDLRGFTKLGDHNSTATLVNILDQYFECVAGPVEDAGGEILKFIGDAVLAVFPLHENPEKTCKAALTAAQNALQTLSDWSKVETEPARPQLKAGIALHVGEVFYGNIGGRSRLDFTVIGSAVNEASRIESLCKSISPLLTSKDFFDLIQDDKMVSVGQHQLRGVNKMHEVFTLPDFL